MLVYIIVFSVLIGIVLYITKLTQPRLKLTKCDKCSKFPATRLSLTKLGGNIGTATFEKYEANLCIKCGTELNDEISQQNSKNAYKATFHAPLEILHNSENFKTFKKAFKK